MRNGHRRDKTKYNLNPLNAKLNPIYDLLAVLGTHPILHVSRIRVKHKLTETKPKRQVLEYREYSSTENCRTKMSGLPRGIFEKFRDVPNLNVPNLRFLAKTLTTVCGHLAGKHWFADTSTVESTLNWRQR